MFEEFVHALMEQWGQLAEDIFKDVGAAKIWAFAIPLVPATYGVWIKWRNSGYRMLNRLEEFVQQQEQRLESVREELKRHAVMPKAHEPHDSPVFDRSRLNKSIRRMNWGYGPVAVGNLHEAAQVSDQRAKLAQAQARQHAARKALAHLLIGAREAAKQFDDPHKTVAARAVALTEFENALAIDPNDPEALHYSGLMMLQLARPVDAATRFKRLIELRGDAGGKALADSYRLLAAAYENYPQPRLNDASGALTKSIAALPPGHTLDLALMHEHQGWVRFRMKAQNALTSFRDAERLFATLNGTVEGREGLKRVREAIAAFNKDSSVLTEEIVD